MNAEAVPVRITTFFPRGRRDVAELSSPLTVRTGSPHHGAIVGASREMVSRVVKDLDLRGLIEVGGGRIVLREAGSP